MIGILNAFHFDKDPNTFQKQYASMILNYFSKNVLETNYKSYLVGQGEFPKSTDECDAWVISGSPMDAYSSESWVKWLRDFVRKCHKEKRKLIGICFGHQLIAQALGGEVQKSEKGQGVGVRQFKMIKNKNWMQPQLQKCSLLFFHQDQVLRLPENAKLLATDEFCEVQMYTIEDHIFCMQGHPEFCVDFMRSRIEVNKQILGAHLYKTASESLTMVTDEATIGTWFKNFLNFKNPDNS